MLAACPKGINNCLMTICLPLSRKKFATLISMYTPTMTNHDKVKDRFCKDLKDTISAVPREDKLIIRYDFNAHVGRDHMLCERVMIKIWHGKV